MGELLLQHQCLSVGSSAIVCAGVRRNDWCRLQVSIRLAFAEYPLHIYAIQDLIMAPRNLPDRLKPPSRSLMRPSKDSESDL